MADNVPVKSLLHNGWSDLEFEPFKDGITAHWFQQSDPQIALLRSEAGASAPLLRHTGIEITLVLEGTQSDENGTYAQRDSILNAEGSEASVWSEDGRVILLQWQEPVQFL
jgi:anti-sigma factor ChrR (cupin superfamily)